jgi:hypothetical protein
VLTLASLFAGFVDSIVGRRGCPGADSVQRAARRDTRGAAGHQQERIGLGHGRGDGADHQPAGLRWRTLLPAAAFALVGSIAGAAPWSSSW